MSLKYTIPSGLVATPSVSVQPPSKTRSSLAPAGRTLWSPVGAGKPGSSARAAQSVRNTQSARARLLILDLRGNTSESLSHIVNTDSTLQALGRPECILAGLNR